MVIISYDGINASLIVDAVQLKAICAVLDLADAKVFEQAATLLKTDGWLYDAKEMAAFVAQSSLICRKITDNVKKTEVCPDCGVEEKTPPTNTLIN